MQKRQKTLVTLPMVRQALKDAGHFTSSTTRMEAVARNLTELLNPPRWTLTESSGSLAYVSVTDGHNEFRLQGRNGTTLGPDQKVLSQMLADLLNEKDWELSPLAERMHGTRMGL